MITNDWDISELDRLVAEAAASRPVARAVPVLASRTRERGAAVVPAWLRRLEDRAARAAAVTEAREARHATVERQKRRNRLVRRIIGRKPRRQRWAARLAWRAVFALAGGRA